MCVNDIASPGDKSDSLGVHHRQRQLPRSCSIVPLCLVGYALPLLLPTAFGPHLVTILV